MTILKVLGSIAQMGFGCARSIRDRTLDGNASERPGDADLNPGAWAHARRLMSAFLVLGLSPDSGTPLQRR
jgi:hypothetical protein